VCKCHSAYPCLDNGHGLDETLGVHTITLGHGMEQGTSPPQGGFANIGSQRLSGAQVLLGWRDHLATAIDFAFFFAMCVCV